MKIKTILTRLAMFFAFLSLITFLYNMMGILYRINPTIVYIIAAVFFTLPQVFCILIPILAALLEWFRNYSRQANLHWFPRFVLFFSIPMILPMFLETFLLSAFLNATTTKQMTADQGLIYSCYTTLGLYTFSQLLAYIQADIFRVRGFEFGKVASFWFRFVGDLASIFIVLLANLSHARHPEVTDYKKEFACPEFLSFLGIFFFFGYLVIFDHYATKFFGTKDRQEKREPQPCLEELTLEDTKRILRKGYNKTWMYKVDLVLHYFCLCFMALFIGSITMAINGFLGRISSNWQNTSSTLISTKFSNNAVYMSSFTGFNNLIMLAFNTFVIAFFTWPEAKNVIQQLISLICQVIGGFPFLFIGLNVNPIVYWQTGQANQTLFG